MTTIGFGMGDTNAAFGTTLMAATPDATTLANDHKSKSTASMTLLQGRIESRGGGGGAAEVTHNALVAFEMQYFKAASLYRRRKYEKCVEVCNAILQEFHERNIQMFTTPPDEEEVNGIGGSFAVNHRVHSSNLQRATVISSARGQHGGHRFNSSSNDFQAHNYYNNNNNNNQNYGSYGAGAKPVPSSFSLPTWLMEDVWQLKMRALTQRVYIDDLETNDDVNEENEEIEFERLATAARPGTSIKNTFVPRPSTSTLRSRISTASSTSSQNRRTSLTSSSGASTAARPMSSLGTRPTSGMARPGTGLSRPGTALGSRPASRCGTASRVRSTAAAAFSVGDATASLYQASRLNPTIYADRQVLVKALFQFLFYHEADLQKAYSLCEAVIDIQKQQKRMKNTQKTTVDWWWLQQMGRCLLTLHYPRKAESFLEQSLELFPHPDTYLLLSRLYQRLEQPERAQQVINNAIDRHPFDVTFRTEQGRLFDVMTKPDDAMQIYRLIARLNPINIEALACIALNYFYENNPEMALMYYRRILSLGVHSPELYCNIALCCLYGGQIDLVLPCFQRALKSCKSPDQKADIWYNLSFVAITTGDFNLAKRCLQLCLSSDARNGAALNNLAVLSAHNGEIMKAKSYLVAAKEILLDSMEIEANLIHMDKYYKL